MAKRGALLWLAAASVSAFAAAPERPPIVGIANIAVKVSDLDVTRKFYGQALGYQEAFTLKQAAGHPDLVCFKINDHQYIEVSPELKGEKEDRLIHIGFETAAARYFAGKGIAVPAKVAPGPDGDLSFTVQDPDGHTVEFVQYLPQSIHSRNFGKFMSDARVSDHALHVGIHVVDRAAADRFYADVLGFRLMWAGGRYSCPKARTGWST